MIKYFPIFNLSIFFFSFLSIFNFNYIIAKEIFTKEVLTSPNNRVPSITNIDQYEKSILIDKKVLPNHFKKIQFFFSIANNLDWNQRIAWLATVGENGYDLDEIIPSSFPGKEDIVEKLWQNKYIPSGGIYLNNNQLVNFNVNLIMDLQMKVSFSDPMAPIDQILFFLHYHY